MNSKAITAFILSIVVVVYCLSNTTLSCYAEGTCQESVGRLVSLQGEAQVRRSGTSSWQLLALEAEFCPGDILRVLANGRVAVALSNETVIRVDRNSTISFSQLPDDTSSILEILHGALHIFSNRPRSLKVVTPYVNGIVEGTEFLVHVDTDRSVISVFEGKVIAENQRGRVQLTSGQSAIAKKDTAPVERVIVKPRDAVQWTLYYPVIIDSSAAASPEYIDVKIRLAASALLIGRIDHAESTLRHVLQVDSENSNALALFSIVETVRNNKDSALELALQAVHHSPHSASANLALSYAYQAMFDLSSALKTLEQLAEISPENSLVQARLAELLLAVGEYEKAMETARKAVWLNPEHGLSHTIVGFTYLSRMELDKSLAAFNTAILADSALPLARVGLGLAKIRMGQLAEGRANLEIAAALDPGNALIRSYLGKAYFEEKRDSHARRQYAIAKQLDPADPTPWFYDAILKETISRPVEALHDLHQSIVRNSHRAVYRSRFLLDSDLAARSAGLGQIYTDLGFHQLARIEGLKSVQTDPANYSAHRFLADTYASLPRHEVARVSELLRSQLLQPLHVSPVQPQLAESNLSILEGAGPTFPSTYEYTPLFLRNKMALQVNGAVGSNDTLGDEVVWSGVEGRNSYSLGQFHYQSDGIRENSDQDQDIYSAFFQSMISPGTSVMAEVRRKETTFGDRTFQFDPTDFSSTLRNSEDSTSARVGIRHDLQPHSTLIGTAIINDDDDNATTGSDGFSLDIELSSEVESRMVEAQHIYKGKKFNLQSGIGYLNADETFTAQITSPFTRFSAEDIDIDHVNFYSYAQIDLPFEIQTTLGISCDFLDSPERDRDELNPKFGLTWQPTPTTLIRAVTMKTLARRFINAQSIEPTQVAGFNQYFDDVEAARYWTYGLGVDHTFSPEWYGGLEFYHRNMDVPFDDINLVSGAIEPKEDDWLEDIGSAYVYWAAADWLTIGLDYYFERFSHDRFEGERGIHDLTTHRIVPHLHFFSSFGLSAKIQAGYIDQEGEFGSGLSGFETDSDRFWVVDFSIRYRLPKRYGFFKVEIKNLFDERFHFLDTDPAHPQYLQEQQIFASLTISL